jgi:hypothetical protein
MIGVIADSTEHEVVREFFELFKTPWEFYRQGGRYDVVVCTGGGEVDQTAKLVILYAGRRIPFDDQQCLQLNSPRKHACILRHPAGRLPVYGDSIRFGESGTSLLADEETGQCMAYLHRSEERVVVRVGYDLFAEIGILLTAGQPVANAGMPALDLHIAFLRDVITGSGVPLAEIPPVPDGYSFIACLTHDVDHPSIRRHQWDHTTLGFLYRAVFSSLFDLVRGRMSVREVLTNWAAAVKLPFVQWGVARDFWREFDDRYLEIEQGLPSTFFIIPFQGRPGKRLEGSAPKYRAARYGAQDIAGTIQRLLTAGCEVALHGIDAWIDSSKGIEELGEIQRLTGVSKIGVRMHWLYYDRQSPSALENAGAIYDSTAGYNETVGYRAGTTQAYKPLEARELLELPLHVMDTALFYPAHLGLSQKQARTRISPIMDHAVRFGGCLTVNWHDRSVAPERLWGACYGELVQDLKDRGAWFATASEATAWFRKRRLARFDMDSSAPGGVRTIVGGNQGDGLPGLQLRIQGKASGGSLDNQIPCEVVR